MKSTPMGSELSIITRRIDNEYDTHYLLAAQYEYFLKVDGEEIQISRDMAYGIMQVISSLSKESK